MVPVLRDVSGPELSNATAMSSPFIQSAVLSVAVDPVALVVTECITVTSAMRKHARWQHSSVSAILGGGTSKPPPYRMRSKDDKNPVLEQLKKTDGEEALASRWGLRGKKGKSMEDNPLMASFTRLRSDLKDCRDIRAFDTPALLHPFLLVIRSSSTSAPITSLALIALTKFLSYNVIGLDSPRLSQAMQLLSSAITHCRFEATAEAADEVVLLRILKLMEVMISGPGRDILSDESVCEMMETGISMCCQPRLSEVLRRSAEISMVYMCQIIFQRLKHLEVSAGQEPTALDEDTKGDMGTVKMEPTVNGVETEEVNGDAADSEMKAEMLQQKAEEGRDTSAHGAGLAPPAEKEGKEQRQNDPITDTKSDVDAKPYSLPSIRELFRVLVELLDPHEKQHTDTMRVMALRIVDVALEVAGPSIANHPTLIILAKDTLCRNLFQLVRSDNMAILNESLRVAGTLLSTCRSVLKLQQELFLSYLVACLHPRVEIPHEPGIDPALYQGVPQAPRLGKQPPSQTSSGRSTPIPVKDRQRLGLEGGTRKPDAREAMVESLGALVRIPSFMVELFVNYDCDVNRADLCVDMIGLLSRNAFPDSAVWSTANVAPLCLDTLLGFVQSVADRIGKVDAKDASIDAKHLREQRNKKKIITRGATIFNEDPKGGISYLVSQRIIDDPNNPISIAKFIKNTSRLDKKVVGDFISKRNNIEILNSYLDLFDFTDQRIDEALRQLLGSFRLPGESPLIERIVTVFSDKYCANSTPDEIANKDAAFVLTYAIIMLNTDQHNPNMKQKRMSLEDFSRNLRGVNDGKDFGEEYLNSIYELIKTREILLPEEHDNKNAYEYAWSELLLKINSEADMVSCNTNAYDADVFAATWRPIIATLSYVFMSASDDTVFSRTMAGFDQCAQIATAYELSDALDHIIFCLSSISTLASSDQPNTALNTEIQADDRSIMVSETAVKFGRDFKAQLATVVLFRLLSGNEAVIQKGWDYIIRIFINLVLNSLVSPEVILKSQKLELPPIPLQPPSNIVDRAERPNESGLFSVFTSYVSSLASDEPPEPSDAEVESTLCTVDCVKACSLDEIFANIIILPAESLKSLIQSLLSFLPDDTAPRVIVVKPEMPHPTPIRPNGTKASLSKPTYNPSLLLILEYATSLALRDRTTIKMLGKQVADALQGSLRENGNLHPEVVSRLGYCLFSLLHASNDFDFIRAPVLLHTFSSMNIDLLKQSAPLLLKGISDCIAGPPGLRCEMANSPDFWSLLRMLHTVPDVSDKTFHIVTELIALPSAITTDNYEALIVLLNDFATAGSIGVSPEKQIQKDRRKMSVKPTSQSDNVIKRGCEAVTLIHNMTNKIPDFIKNSHLEPTNAWNAYWSPIFRALTSQCLNPCREIRHQAISSLQRSLLSADLASASHKEWIAIFSEVLFPLIGQLLKPEVYQSDPVGMSDTRVQAATLLCKIFLHYLVLLSEWEQMLDIWLRILAIMDRLMNSGQGDHLEEAVPENLKNILLVMSSGGYLAPPDEKPENAELWIQSWNALDRFLPGLFVELFPEEAKKPRLPRKTTETLEGKDINSSKLPEGDSNSTSAPAPASPSASAPSNAIGRKNSYQLTDEVESSMASKSLSPSSSSSSSSSSPANHSLDQKIVV